MLGYTYDQQSVVTMGLAPISEFSFWWGTRNLLTLALFELNRKHRKSTENNMRITVQLIVTLS